MIVYDKLWQTLKRQGLSQYKLIKEYGISSGQLDRLRKNANVNTYTLNQLCEILQCELSDIAEFVSEKQCKSKLWFIGMNRKNVGQGFIPAVFIFGCGTDLSVPYNFLNHSGE